MSKVFYEPYNRSQIEKIIVIAYLLILALVIVTYPHTAMRKKHVGTAEPAKNTLSI